MKLGIHISSRIQSFTYAFKGLSIMMHRQYNFFIHISLAIIAIVLGFLFNIKTSEFLWIIAAIGMVISAEIFNTAIEKLTDLIQPEKDPRAGQIKDLAAGAVLITAITALTIGLIIFIPYL